MKDQARGGDTLRRRQAALRGQQTVSLGEQGRASILERVGSLPGQPRQDKASTGSARMQNNGMGVSSYNHKGPRSGIGNYSLQGNNQVTLGWRQQEWRSRKER